MQLSRLSPAALTVASLLALAACGDSAAPPAAAPASSAAASTTPADRKLCSSVQKIGQDLKDKLVDASQSKQDPTPELFQNILNKLAQQVTAEAFDASSSPVVRAARQLAAEAAEAAKSTDPVAALGAGTFDQASTDLTSACRSVGVDVTF
ncbi:hypothetical protein [Actinoplanes sp. N902-109]|uniref:hypothetical protein n=1 Tax=Actinoplanes sp. (strain N902-109) TaxID=649831 RepID=UPI0003294BE4|nr:hypothetical protein [Actinoplanes sp. N902-109]AGL17017.1 hypothetical protein L083_3507 [Actinoplanes sp. N902-109]